MKNPYLCSVAEKGFLKHPAKQKIFLVSAKNFPNYAAKKDCIIFEFRNNTTKMIIHKKSEQINQRHHHDTLKGSTEKQVQFLVSPFFLRTFAAE